MTPDSKLRPKRAEDWWVARVAGSFGDTVALYVDVAKAELFDIAAGEERAA